MATFLTGFRRGDWRRLLQEHAPSIDPKYRLRGVKVAVASAATAALARFEPVRPLPATLEDAWEQPVFLLGLPRSGTTFLQQLFAANPRLAFPTRMDCFNPWTFVALHRIGVGWLLGQAPRRSRGIDRVRIGWDSPEEDEFALTVLTAEGPWLAAIFPRCADRHRQSYPGHPEWQGAERWRDSLRTFTRKLVGLYCRPLVLKSPYHTGRIPDLLSVFPRAKFVTILRDPRDQFRSAIDVPSSARLWPAVQDAGQTEASAVLREEVRLQRLLTDRYFETRSSIPDGRLREVTYEALVRDPLHVLQQLHEQLQLPGWAETAARLQSDTWWRGYEGNPRRALRPEEQGAIPSAYRALFAAGYYPETLAACQR